MIAIFKSVIKSQTALGGFQLFSSYILLNYIHNHLEKYHDSDRHNFNCDPKPSDFIRQSCYNNYLSTVTKPHGIIPQNVVAITRDILCTCWIALAIYGAVTLRRRPGYEENNANKYLCAYFIHVIFRILFLGVMLGLVCSYHKIILPSVFECVVNQTNSQTAPSPLNQTKITLICNDLHHKEKSNLNIAFIVVNVLFMVLSIFEVLHLWRNSETYLQHLIGDLEDFMADDSPQRTVITPGENRSSAKKRNASPPELNIALKSMSDLPETSLNWNNVELPVDILLLTVEECEFLSCFAYLKEPFRSYYDRTGYVYFDQREDLNIALMRCDKRPADPRGSLTTSIEAILKLNPKVIFSVGACSGLKKVKLGDVVVSAKLITASYKTPLSRDIGMVIQHVAAGWKAPVKNANECNAELHSDGVVLSVSGANRDIIGQHPEAIAVEMEGGGEGVFAAAYNAKIEWVVVKGIKDVADETQSSSKKWKEVACVMAASVVAKILNDPVIFKDWRHSNRSTAS